MSLKNFKFLVLTSVIFLSSCFKIDETMKLFFPSELKELQFVQTQFSAFWWNFIIIEPEAGPTSADFKTANALCEKLKLHIDHELRLVFCGSSMLSAEKILKPWGQDYVLRHKFNPADESKYLSSVTQASMQLGFLSNQKQLFSILRFDPFQSWQDFIELSKNSMIDSFEKNQGYLFDSKTNRLIIPLQFNIRPEMQHIQPIMDILTPFQNAFMVGSHGSTYRNEKQVRDDLSKVSILSGIIFFAFIAFLVFKSRINTLLLAVPVTIAMTIATLVTQMIYGSIHGLTLSFGSGIVGLALDYGLHGAFGSESKQTWKSNAIGLLTTLSGVGILILSGIPLIRQMMIFSSLGLLIGFFIYFILFKYWPNFFKIKSINCYLPEFTKKQTRYVFAVITLIMLIGTYGLVHTRMTMDLKKLSFVSDHEAELTTWFFSKNAGPNGYNEAFLLIEPLENLNNKNLSQRFVNQSESDWAQSKNIEYEGLSKYLPSNAAQIENYSSWSIQGCDFFKKSTDTNIQKLYAPFIDSVCHLAPLADLPERYLNKPYVSHLIGETHSLSIFTAKDDVQAAQIKKEFPESKSLTQALKNFSFSLEKDLSWMIPVALLLTLIILFLYFKKVKPVLTAILPFATGLSLYFLISMIFKFDIDLISILGLVMVFGFSIDYGVFSTDVHLHAASDNSVEARAEINSVYSALTFAAITNILGFLPMLFAGHPVLLKLGSALFYGTVGTYLGTLFGVYPIYNKSSK